MNGYPIVDVDTESLVPCTGEVEFVIQVTGLVVAVERDGAEKPVVAETVVDLLAVSDGVIGKKDRVALTDRLLPQVVEVIEVDAQGGFLTDGKQRVQIAEMRLVVQVAVGAEKRCGGLLDAQFLAQLGRSVALQVFHGEHFRE